MEHQPVASGGFLRPKLVLGGAIIGMLGLAFITFSVRHEVRSFLTHIWHRLHPIRPNIAWQTATPAEEGMSAGRLQRLTSDLAHHGTKVFIVVRNNHIVWEWYAPGVNPNYRFGTAAMAKAATASIVMATALSDGYLKLTDPAAKYIPAWRNDPVRSKILIEDLASHDSGMADVDFVAAKAGKVAGWKEKYYNEPSNRFSIAIHDVPILFPPGSRVKYSGIGYYALAYAVTKSLQTGPDKTIKSFLRDQVMKPLGVPDNDWALNYGQSYKVDGMTLYAFSSGASYTARTLARVGQLVLDHGEWNGKRIFSPVQLKQLLNSCRVPVAGLKPSFDHPIPGGGWWLNKNGLMPALTPDALVGFGNHDECLLVVPSYDLVAVRLGDPLDSGHGGSMKTAYQRVFAPLMQTIIGPPPDTTANPPSSGKPPYRPSPVIKGITWDWRSRVRKAPGSDLWPVTWGADGNLYAAWGDGGGFGGTDSKGRVSLGFAKIEGSPEHFKGVNIWGGEAAQKPARFTGKCAGMISVAGTLYALINLQNRPEPYWDTTLAWSDDFGASWKKASWIFPGTNGAFRPECFLNFGRDNAGARDQYIYFYGPNVNGQSGIYVGRALQQKLRDKTAYEYFTGLDGHGDAKWSSNIEDRRPCFVDHNGVSLFSVIYDRPLDRYIATVAHGNVAHLGIFDATTPWGPWTTVAYYDHWGNYSPTNGESLVYSFPTKWISKDGLSLWMIYTAYNPPTDSLDSFNLIKGTLQLVK